MATAGTVYFLANDTMLEFVIAFLNSFRAYNPGNALCLIPFDDECEQLLSLQSEYRFTVWADSDVLHRCDAISLRFHGRIVGHYRKLAMWSGEAEHFLYIDTDTVVLSNVDFVFRFLPAIDFLTSHSELPELRQWVWMDSIYATGILTDEQIRFSTNTGFIASRRALLSLDEVEKRLPSALELAPHMVLSCKEQPFLNYLMITSGLYFDSLSAIARRSGRMDIPCERWGGGEIGAVEGGRITSPKHPPVLLVHWAGEWQRLAEESLPNADLWSFYRSLRAPE
jgi:hypothetical protein